MSETELVERLAAGEPDDDTNDAQVEPDDTTPPAGKSWTRPPLTTIVVVAALVAGIVAALVVGFGWRNDASKLRDNRASAAQAEKAAVIAARLLLGLNQSSGPDTLAKLKASATGDFAEQVTLLSDTVSGVLRAGQVQSQGNVAASGVEKSSAKEATVLLAATALVSNSELPNGELRTFRMVAHMTKVGDTWKVSGMDFLS